MSRCSSATIGGRSPDGVSVASRSAYDCFRHRSTLAVALLTFSSARRPLGPDAEGQPRRRDDRGLHEAGERIRRASEEAGTDPCRSCPTRPRREQMDMHERALGKLIQENRADAKPHDIFTPPMQQICSRRCCEPSFADPGGAQVKKEILEEYTEPVTLKVNGRYPDAVPLSTVPPQVLKGLPDLPEELAIPFRRRPSDPARSPRAHHRRLHGACVSMTRRDSAILRADDASSVRSCLGRSPGSWPALWSWPPDATASRPAAAVQAAGERTLKELPNRPDSLKFAVIGDNGTGETPAVRSRQADVGVARQVSVRAGGDDGRQHLRLGSPAGLRRRSSRCPTSRCSTPG